jgi:cytoskeletal protein RodZ
MKKNMGWKKNMGGLEWGCIIVVIFVVIMIGIVWGQTKCWTNTENKAKDLVKDLIANIDKYSEMEGEYVEGVPQKPTKYFIIENTDPNKPQAYEWSPQNSTLPEELQAKSVEELNTLVRLQIYHAVTGKYEDGSLAYTEYADVTVFDMKTGNIIAKTTLSAPPQAVKVGPKEDKYGDVTLWIADYLKNIAGVN